MCAITTKHTTKHGATRFVASAEALVFGVILTNEIYQRSNRSTLPGGLGNAFTGQMLTEVARCLDWSPEQQRRFEQHLRRAMAQNAAQW